MQPAGHPNPCRCRSRSRTRSSVVIAAEGWVGSASRSRPAGRMDALLHGPHRWAIMLKSPSPICPQMTFCRRDAMQNASAPIIIMAASCKASAFMLLPPAFSSSITAWNQCDPIDLNSIAHAWCSVTERRHCQIAHAVYMLLLLALSY